MASPKYSVLQVRPAKDSLIGPAAFSQFLASLKSSLKATLLNRLFGSYETINLEIVNLNQTTFFVIACPERLEHLVRSQIAAQYPDSLITPMEDYLPNWINHNSVTFGQLKLTSYSHLPINVLAEKDVDQMASILGGLSRLSPGNAAIIQLCLYQAPKNWQKSIRSLLDAGIPSGEPGKVKPHPQKALIELKLAAQSFGVDIRLVAIAPDDKQSKQLITQLAASFGTYTLPEGNGFALNVPKSYSQAKLGKAILERSARYAPTNQFLNYQEISAIFHFPNATLASTKNIAWGKTLKGEPPVNLPVDEGLMPEERDKVNFFAKTEYKNHVAVFGMKKGDDRRRHVYILGKSGTGKSTLLANMAISDIQHGEGMAFVDPHGDTAEKLLDYIPENRINDVAYLDPSTADKSFRLNPLYVKNPAYGELVASGIVSIFSKLYGNSWGPRLEYILRNTLLTLVNRPGATLLDVPRLLTNKPFREDYLLSVKDTVLINFWHDEYDKYSEKFQSEAISPILNKVGQFITSPTIRDVISHPTSTVDFEDMMNQGKIVILNLPQGKIGEDNAALLGAMFISQIQIAAMNRASMAEETRKDFFMYVDEFQNFATTSFIKILSEARKYRLNLILANQYTAQLPIEIQDAIFGNAGTLISYVVGAADANRLMNELGNFYTQDDLVSLPRYQMLVKMSVNATISMPFPAYALPPSTNKYPFKKEVLAASESQYYRVVESIADSQIQLSVPTPTTSTNGDRNSYGRPQLNNRTSGHIPPTNSTASTPVLTNSVQPLTSPISAPAVPKPNLVAPSSEELDTIRKTGFRPSVVGCFLNNKKILMVFQKNHNLWQFPQGGVDNGETIFTALERETAEEVDPAVVTNFKSTPALIYQDQIEFPPEKQNLRDLKTDAGEQINMLGKKYFFLVTELTSSTVNLKPNEFSEYRWLDYDEAIKLTKETNTGGKLRIVSAVLSKLKINDYLAFTPVLPRPMNYQSNQAKNDRYTNNQHSNRNISGRRNDSGSSTPRGENRNQSHPTNNSSNSTQPQKS